MNNISKIGIVFGFFALLAACKSDSEPNYQYFPQMYEPVGYEAYGKVGFLPDGMAAMQPADNTIPRGFMPNSIPNDLEGKDLARIQPSPLDSLQRDANLAKGKELYDIYCAICHGNQGNGQGNLVKREKNPRGTKL